jgi:hypothetical protein
MEKNARKSAEDRKKRVSRVAKSKTVTVIGDETLHAAHAAAHITHGSHTAATSAAGSISSYSMPAAKGKRDTLLLACTLFILKNFQLS